MKFCLWKYSLATLAAVLLTCQARAIPYLQLVGEPRDGNSWSQVFHAGGQQFGISFNSLEAYSADGSSIFEAPGFLEASDGGWTTTWESDFGLRAEGSFMNELTFRFRFLGDSDTSAFTMNVNFYNSYQGMDPVATVIADWNGSVWSLIDNPPGFDPPAVPDGGTTLVLLGLGTFGLLLMRRR